MPYLGHRPPDVGELTPAGADPAPCVVPVDVVQARARRAVLRRVRGHDDAAVLLDMLGLSISSSPCHDAKEQS